MVGLFFYFFFFYKEIHANLLYLVFVTNCDELDNSGPFNYI